MPVTPRNGLLTCCLYELCSPLYTERPMGKLNSPTPKLPLIPSNAAKCSGVKPNTDAGLPVDTERTRVERTPSPVRYWRSH